MIKTYTETPIRRTVVGDSGNKGVRPVIASGGPDQHH